MSAARVRARIDFEPGDVEYERGFKHGYLVDGHTHLLVRYADDVEFRPFGAGYFIPETFEVLVYTAHHNDVVMEFHHIDGAPTCVELKVLAQQTTKVWHPFEHGPVHEYADITGTALRQIRVHQLRQQAVPAAVHVADNGKPAGPPETLQEWGDLYTESVETAKGRPAELDDEHYRRVAEVYRDAVASGAPTKTVAETWTVARSTAAKWVMEARQRGLLGPTEPGLAGETSRPEQQEREDER